MTSPACEEIRLELPSYTRTGLGPEPASPVERHLRECAACQGELRELKRLETLLDAHLPMMNPSPTFASTFANRLAAEVLAEEEEASSRGGWFGWRLRPWLIPLAVGAVFAGVVVQQTLVGDLRGIPVASLPESASVAEREGAKDAPAARVASAEQPSEARTAAAPPNEILDRLELFVDYAVIEKLEWLDATERSG